MLLVAIPAACCGFCLVAGLFLFRYRKQLPWFQGKCDEGSSVARGATPFLRIDTSNCGASSVCGSGIPLGSRGSGKGGSAADPLLGPPSSLPTVEDSLSSQRTTLKDVIDESYSGSGSGPALLVQRRIAQQIWLEMEIGKGRFVKKKSRTLATSVFSALPTLSP